MRAWIGFGIVVVTLGIAVAMTLFAMAYSTMGTALLIGAVMGALAAAGARVYVRRELQPITIFTSLVWGAILGALATGIPWKRTHESWAS